MQNVYCCFHEQPQLSKLSYVFKCFNYFIFDDHTVISLLNILVFSKSRNLLIMPVAILSPISSVNFTMVRYLHWNSVYTVAMTYGSLYSTQSFSPSAKTIPAPSSNQTCFHHMLFWFVKACVVVFVFKTLVWPLLSFIPTKRAKVFAINYIPQL